ncbi:hypothetical protein [Shewanella xiamenensis]|uniref:hypothetical protein n=1 Tax=Shewanella xiamenensis TaxID=332186 RepID=UPI0035B78DE6
MSGIIFFLMLTLWVFMAKKIAVLFSSVFSLPDGNKRLVVIWSVFVFILLFPIADEIIGWFQFNNLCTEKNTLIYDKDKVYGKSVIRRDIPLDGNWAMSTKIDIKKSKGITMYTLHKAIPIVVTTTQWEDAETGELLITHRLLQAKGGWLSHLIGFPQGSPPYIFDGRCSSRKYYELFESLNVDRVKNK